MKLPRDLGGSRLIKALAKLGYKPIRQSGSHVRLVSQLDGEHHITIPLHDPLRVGTLSAIVSDLAEHHSTSRERIIALLTD